jgi:hypothetical protein
MSFADFAAIGVLVFTPYVLFWCLIFLVVCVILAAFVGLLLFVMSRI